MKVDEKEILKRCHEIAKSRGGTCLSNKYDCGDLLEFSCKNGHIFCKEPKDIKNRWCWDCAKNKRFSIEDCDTAAKLKNGICISREYKNNHTSMQWKCKEGHIFNMEFRNVRDGHWCQKCSNRAPHCLEDCIAAAKEKNGKCMSAQYGHIRLSMEWACEKNHLFTMTAGNVFAGHWCQECAGVKPHSIEECNMLALDRNGQCLSKIYKNAYTKIKWECENNHIFSSTISAVLNNQWCPKCANDNQRLGIGACHKLARSMDGYCLGEEYVNNHSKMMWKCAGGHKFEKSYNQAKHNWCTECNTWKTQKLLSDIIRDVFPNYDMKINYRGFKWLINPKTKRKLEVDIWIPGLKLAIEYDGEYHFKPVKYKGMTDEQTKRAFKKIKFLDRIKNKTILEHSDEIKYFVRFNCKQKIDKELVQEVIFKHLRQEEQL